MPTPTLRTCSGSWTSRRAGTCPLLLYLGLASGTAQAVINTYGTGLDTSSIIPRLNRIQATFVACLAATALVYAGYFWSGIIEAVSTALSILACFSVSWIVAMIIGFVHRKGFYLTDDLQVFNRGQRGGRYWFSHGLNWRATGPWLLGAAVGMLFTNTTWFLGPGPTSSASGTSGSSCRRSSPAFSIRSSSSCSRSLADVFEDGAAEWERTHAEKAEEMRMEPVS